MQSEYLQCWALFFKTSAIHAGMRTIGFWATSRLPVHAWSWSDFVGFLGSLNFWVWSGEFLGHGPKICCFFFPSHFITFALFFESTFSAVQSLYLFIKNISPFFSWREVWFFAAIPDTEPSSKSLLPHPCLLPFLSKLCAGVCPYPTAESSIEKVLVPPGSSD